VAGLLKMDEKSMLPLQRRLFILETIYFYGFGCELLQSYQLCRTHLLASPVWLACFYRRFWLQTIFKIVTTGERTKKVQECDATEA
jgi:hypothetical protein